MERKHQVFVSSTFKDLVEERKEVIHALLELDCIPAGMELFPAADEDAWSLITEVIDGCDYYVLILAGKYGSTNSKGIGYTEMEFDYAAEIGKPIICFLHQDVGDLPSSKVESSEVAQERLKKFRIKAEGKHCKYWSTPHDLGGKVSRSLIQLKKKHPSDGWVPGRFAADQKMLAEIERLRAKVAELEYDALAHKDAPPPNYEELAGGKDVVKIVTSLIVDEAGTIEDIVLEVTWDRLFSYCGAALSGECTTDELNDKIRLCMWHAVPNELEKLNSFSGIVLRHVTADQIHIQLQALGLMEPGIKKRQVSDNNTYWRLTPFGEKHLIQIRAMRRKSNNSIKSTADAATD